MSSYNEFIGPLAGAIGAVILFTAISIWGRQRGLELLRRWATVHGFVLVSARRRSFVPHWSSESGKGYQFFRVTVRDKEGALRKSWIRCSDFTWHDPNKIDVIWDDESTKHKSS